MSYYKRFQQCCESSDATKYNFSLHRLRFPKQEQIMKYMYITVDSCEVECFINHNILQLFHICTHNVPSHNWSWYRYYHSNILVFQQLTISFPFWSFTVSKLTQSKLYMTRYFFVYWLQQLSLGLRLRPWVATPRTILGVLSWTWRRNTGWAIRYTLRPWYFIETRTERWINTNPVYSEVS